MRACLLPLLALPLLRTEAQGVALDRTRAPRLSTPARLTVPVVRPARLVNGLSLRVVEDHELPLVQVTALIDGGARLDGATPGLATFTAEMLDEGAGTRDATELQSELAYLGASLTTSAGWDNTIVSLKVPARSLAPALDLMADVILRPTFREEAVRRQRGLRLAGLLQLRDQPNALAALAFNQQLFPASHPYHHPAGGDSAATAGLDSARLRRFYDGAVRPERTTFIVVGALAAADARRAIASRFGTWRGAGTPATLRTVTTSPVARTSTAVFLVDKPDAAQSVIQIGWPGVDRRSPDYAALMVMNTLLGGSFTSRLNMNLRETKGYSYGANSNFAFRRVPGPFTAGAAVRTNVTDSSLVEFFRELRRIRENPVTRDELDRARAYVELGLPGSLEGTSRVASRIAELLPYGLTLAELPRFAAQVRAVTTADVQRVAQRYLTPDRATVVVVGDVAKVRASIDALDLGASTVLSTRTVAR